MQAHAGSAAAAQRGIFQRGEVGQRGRGARGGSLDGVQQRTYRFPETNEKIEYDVFVSRKLTRKEESTRHRVAWNRMGTPLDLMRNVTNAAGKGGYIVATPMGYNLQGWYGANGPASRNTTLGEPPGNSRARRT